MTVADLRSSSFDSVVGNRRGLTTSGRLRQLEDAAPRVLAAHAVGDTEPLSQLVPDLLAALRDHKRSIPSPVLDLARAYLAGVADRASTGAAAYLPSTLFAVYGIKAELSPWLRQGNPTNSGAVHILERELLSPSTKADLALCGAALTIPIRRGAWTPERVCSRCEEKAGHPFSAAALFPATVDDLLARVVAETNTDELLVELLENGADAASEAAKPLAQAAHQRVTIEVVSDDPIPALLALTDAETRENLATHTPETVMGVLGGLPYGKVLGVEHWSGMYPAAARDNLEHLLTWACNNVRTASALDKRAA